MICPSLALVLAALATGSSASSSCPPGSTALASFEAEGVTWQACEDLSLKQGGITLVSADETVTLPKTAEPINTDDSDYYLGMNKSHVLASRTDVLGDRLLSSSGDSLSWTEVEKAIPPLRKSSYGPWGKAAGGCVRTFVGSRSAAYDVSFSDAGEPCGNAPPFIGGVVHASNASQQLGADVEEGLVGGFLPIVVFYYPVVNSSNYWTMVAAPKPDMQGSREQDVWYRFQQISGSGDLVGNASFFDTYYWSGPGPGPVSAPAAPFYANMLDVHRYWTSTFKNESQLEVSLPSVTSTNGSWLHLQAKHGMVKGMITRVDTWHPRYGVSPGYGAQADPGNGFQDTLTCELQGSLEWSNLPYARGILDNYLRFYIRPDGAVSYRGPATADSAIILTLIAKHYSYSRDASLLIEHHKKIKGIVSWLNASRELSLSFPNTDPRYGIPIGDSEADNFVRVEGYPHFSPPTAPVHYYSSAAATARGYLELGRVWSSLGKSAVLRHGQASMQEEMITMGVELQATAALLRRDMDASMNRTVIEADPTANGTRCWPFMAEAAGRNCTNVHLNNVEVTPWRTYAEWMYSGMLTKAQVDDMYTNLGQGGLLNLGSFGPHGWFVMISHGLAYALLQHDMIARFLLHFYSHSAHDYTRGTWTTPEGVGIDSAASFDEIYAAPGELTVPIYLRWALLFEDPEARALWLCKALPREWLVHGESVTMYGAPTRYGNITMELHSHLEACTILANISVPTNWATQPSSRPPGGVVLRLRPPKPYVGKLETVTLAGQAWPNEHIDATRETVEFTASALSTSTIQRMTTIVATFSGCP